MLVWCQLFFSGSHLYLNHARIANSSDSQQSFKKNRIQLFKIIDSTFLKSKFNILNKLFQQLSAILK